MMLNLRIQALSPKARLPGGYAFIPAVNELEETMYGG